MRRIARFGYQAGALLLAMNSGACVLYAVTGPSAASAGIALIMFAAAMACLILLKSLMTLDAPPALSDADEMDAETERVYAEAYQAIGRLLGEAERTAQSVGGMLGTLRAHDQTSRVLIQRQHQLQQHVDHLNRVRSVMIEGAPSGKVEPLPSIISRLKQREMSEASARAALAAPVAGEAPQVVGEGAGPSARERVSDFAPLPRRPQRDQQAQENDIAISADPLPQGA